MRKRLDLSLSRRQMLKFLGVGAAGLALAACTSDIKEEAVPEHSSGKPVPSGFESGNLTVLVCSDADETREILGKFNEYFEQNYSTINCSLHLTHTRQKYLEKLHTLIAAGMPPDVFELWEGFVQPYAANGLLMDLTSYVEADRDWKLDDFQPAAVEASSYADRQYAIVRRFYPGPAMLFYNKDVFDAARVDYPVFDWNWARMRDAATALANKSGNRWGMAFETRFVIWLYMVWSNGGDLFSADQTRCTLAEPRSVEALQYWADLITKDKCAIPASEAIAVQGVSNAFKTGAACMCMGYLDNLAEMKAAAEHGLNWGCALPPSSPTGKRSFYMYLECWVVSKTSRIPNACWQYIRDFTADYTDDFLKYYPGVPTLKKDIGLFLTEEHKSYGWDRLPEIISDPTNIRIPGAGAGFGRISSLVQAELDLLFHGDKTAQAAAEAAALQVDAVLSR